MSQETRFKDNANMEVIVIQREPVGDQCETI